MDAWLLFLRAHAVLTAQLEQELEAERCLPLTWYDVLVQLNGAPDKRLRMQELVRSLVLSKSGLTRRIDRMEEQGLVERCGCPEDRRGIFVCLTPAGHAALKEAAPVHLAGIQNHFTRFLSEDEAAALRSAFGKIVSGLSQRQTAPSPCESEPSSVSE